MGTSNIKVLSVARLSIVLFPSLILAQIENQIRDDNPGLFKNQRIFHSAPSPFFKGRSYNIDFITDIPVDSILSSTLYFKTNQMKYYQEFQLSGTTGLYRFTYKPNTFPASRIQYYFTIMTQTGIYGAPINDEGNLTPVDKLLVNPVEYFKQQSRLNR